MISQKRSGSSKGGNVVAPNVQKWVSLSLVALVALRSYFVQELIVAFVFFAIGFVVLAVPFVTFVLLVDLFDKALERKDVPMQVAPRHGNVV